MAQMRQGINNKSRNANAVERRSETACHNKSKRIAAVGVTVGTISGVEFTRLKEARGAARAQLDVTEVMLRSQGGPDAYKKHRVARRAFLDACDRVSALWEEKE